MTFIGFIVCAVLIGLNIFVDYRSSDAGKKKKTFKERYQYEENHGLVHSHYADGTPRDSHQVMMEKHQQMFERYEEKYGKDPRWHD